MYSFQEFCIRLFQKVEHKNKVEKNANLSMYSTKLVKLHRTNLGGTIAKPERVVNLEGMSEVLIVAIGTSFIAAQLGTDNCSAFSSHASWKRVAIKLILIGTSCA